jgi:hypothetical protein
MGYVTRVAFGDPGELAVSLALWPGQPRTIAARPMSSAFSEELPMPAIMLAATEEEPATMILPPRTFNPGRVLRSMDTGPERKFRLSRLVQRGGDFERVAFDES